MTYFKWLLSLVNAESTPYTRLYKYLYKVSWKPDPQTILDTDRAKDGIALRREFSRYTGLIPEKTDPDSSVLEMIIALARRIDEIMGEPEENHADTWFDVMLDNLGLSRFYDDAYSERDVKYIVDRLISKRYAANGSGGLFPLSHPMRDQRKIPIWDQASDFIMENY